MEAGASCPEPGPRSRGGPRLDGRMKGRGRRLLQVGLCVAAPDVPTTHSKWDSVVVDSGTDGTLSAANLKITRFSSAFFLSIYGLPSHTQGGPTAPSSACWRVSLQVKRFVSPLMTPSFGAAEEEEEEKKRRRGGYCASDLSPPVQAARSRLTP